MSHVLVDSLKDGVDSAFGMLTQFVKVCPENIWAETSGGWTVWQQVAHAVGAVSLFIDVPGEKGLTPVADPEICGLEKKAETTVPQSRVAEAIEEAQNLIAKYAAALTDEKLGQRNEHLFNAIKLDMTHAATLSLLAGHTLYHLGSCDAALRNHGRPGVF